MAEMTVPVTLEERKAVAAAIKELNGVGHLKYMSRSMISNSACIKETKVRAVLQELINLGEAVQYQATENKKLQRYYYVLTDKGRKLL